MPIVSSKGIGVYTGIFGEKELKHLLRRTRFGIRKSDLTAYNGQTLNQVLSSILIQSPEPSPPLNHYENIIQPQYKESAIPFGTTWVNTTPQFPEINFHKINSFRGWLAINYHKDTTITEKMALFLHSFIPISHDVNDPRFLYRNYKMLRTNALGNFKTVIKSSLLDSGVLKYLNGDVNQKNAPDENLARELQELFTLGKGFTPIYNESDVKEAAKVLTGYTIDRTTGFVVFNPNRHDTTNKTFSSYYNNNVIAGKTGTAGQDELDDLVNMIFQKDDVALHFCRKLYGFFVYYDIDSTIEANVIVPLANIMRSNNYEILPVIQALFASEHFYDTDVYGSHIKSPVDIIFGQYQEMEIALPDNSDILKQYEIYSDMFAGSFLLRQLPYDPPSVSGWEAYYQKPLMHENWITTDTIANRNKYAVGLLIGYTKRSFKIQVDTINYTKGFLNPSDPNKLIDDALGFLHTIPATAELKTYLKSILLFGQSQDYYWTNAWNDHINSPNDAAKKKLVSDLLFAFYKYILELAEYQLM
ncbi:MAG: DUF1800 family protein [Chitinophagales bacterium]|jgi:hypothetical protein|nr:DUF1800 domain-containing protein [Sphingobacteriales bacterium]